MSPLISVIIPVYNMELYLARCLDSVLNSTYRILEILCVDDGSRDRSLEILREYEAKDNRIVVIAKKNGGVSSSRNVALDRANGSFVSFIDPDDYIHPQAYELLLQAQTHAGADVVIGAYSSTKEFSPPAFEHFTFSAEKCSLVSPAVVFKNHAYGSYCWGRLLKKEIIGSLRFNEAYSYSEDALFNAELCEQNPSVSYCVLQFPLYYYFIRESSVTNRLQEEARLSFVSDCLRRSRSKTSALPFFRLAVWRLYRFIDFYRQKPVEAARSAKLLRGCLPRIWFSRLFTLKEKLQLSRRACFRR